MEWSQPVQVSPADSGGHWEPRLAFSDTEGAWIAYDSSAGGYFNLHLARVTVAGEVKDQALTTGLEYEARCSIAADGAGGLWYRRGAGAAAMGIGFARP